MASQNDFTESMAAAAQSVADYFGDRILYINVMNNLSVDCDSSPAAPEMQDIGILASADPVALEQACLDLVYAVTMRYCGYETLSIQREQAVVPVMKFIGVLADKEAVCDYFAIFKDCSVSRSP